MKKILLSIIILTTFGCEPEWKEQQQQRQKTYGYDDLEIVRLRDRDYVRWHNGYGSQMVHAGDCKNH